MRKVCLALALAAIAASSIPASALASNAAIVIAFEKDGSAGHYMGRTEDGGTIEMRLSNSTMTGDVQHFTATLWLSYSDNRSLRAILDGRFDGNTGEVALNGRVVDGWLQGARVHEESRVVAFDPATGVATFVGTLQLMPGSAR